MYIAELNNSSTVETSDINVDREYWHQCLQKYSEEDIGNMVTWLTDKKKTESSVDSVY